DPGRPRAGGHVLTDAELAARVVPPAPRIRIRRDRARVIAAGRDADPRACEHHGQRVWHRVAGAELPAGVIAPARDLAVAERTRVQCARRDDAPRSAGDERRLAV